MATTGSMNNIKPIQEFFSKALHVAVHRVDGSCHSNFYAIDIGWKRWNINFVFNIIPKENITHSEVDGSGRLSAKSQVFSSSPTNPSL